MLGVLAVSITLPVLVGVLAAVAHRDAVAVGEPETLAAPKRERRARAPRSEHDDWRTARARAAARWNEIDPAVVGALDGLATGALVMGSPTADADRLALVLAHVAAHPLATDVDITSATGVPRATVGRWRRRGLLDPPTAEHSLNGKVSG